MQSNSAFRSYVVEGGHKNVKGWVAPGALTAISLLALHQKRLGISGDVIEIGVHHGRLFIALSLIVPNSQACLAIDVFSDQDLNVDNSGRGDIDIFLKNIETHAGTEVLQRTKTLQVDSLTLQANNISEQLNDRKAQLFSVDGGHTVKHVVNDLNLAERSIVPGGIVIVDDFYNTDWPGVNEGVQHYYFSSERPLCPIFYGDNKLYMTDRENAFNFATFFIESRPHMVSFKAVEFFGCQVAHARFKAPENVL